MSFTSFQARQLVRSQPYATQFTSLAAIIPNGGTLLAVFDLAIVTTDKAQLAGGASDTGIASVGPYLDVFVLSTGVGTFDVLCAADIGGTFGSILPAPLAVSAGVVFTISGLRIPARICDPTFTNTSGGNVTVDYGAYIRSN